MEGEQSDGMKEGESRWKGRKGIIDLEVTEMSARTGWMEKKRKLNPVIR